MNHCALVLSLCAFVWFDDPSDQPVFRDRVDLMEVNHFYDERGKLVFNQIIYYDWSEERCRYMVRDWKLLKTSSQVPLKDWQSDEYVAVWYDGDLLRVVRCPLLHETWTQYDPELVEREFLPKDRRALLTRPVRDEILRR